MSLPCLLPLPSPLAAKKKRQLLLPWLHLRLPLKPHLLQQPLPLMQPQRLSPPLPLMQPQPLLLMLRQPQRLPLTPSQKRKSSDAAAPLGAVDGVIRR